MYGWRGILTGALALIVLQVGISGQGPKSVGGVFDFANALARRFIDPTVPAIGARAQAAKAPPQGKVYPFGPPSSGTGAGGGATGGGGGGGGGGAGSGW